MLGAKMAEHRQIVDGRGRVWTVSRVKWQEAEEEDFRFWYDRLSPEERVDAVSDALESCLKTRGLDAIPRLRRVHRRIECPWRAVSGDRRSRRGLSRAAARDKRS